ncbi:MAG: AMP-binding protein, partial [Chthoniobacterales bacterium]
MTQVLEGTSRRVYPTNAYAEFPRSEVEGCIPARFEKQVTQHGQRVALRTKRHELTYEQLNQLANRLAHSILKRSSASPRAVALLMEHDAPLIAAMLAVLKAGRFYV